MLAQGYHRRSHRAELIAAGFDSRNEAKKLEKYYEELIRRRGFSN
jgi:hypothetical protein